MAIANYSWTDRYVVPSGAGSHLGTSWADAFSLAEMVADLATGRRYNLSGTFTPAAKVDTSGTNGTAANPIAFVGWNAAMSAEVVAFDDLPSISGAGHAANVWEQGNYQILRGLKIGSGVVNGVSGASKDYTIMDLCWVHDNTSAGVSISGFGQSISRSKIEGNGGLGCSLGQNSHISLCEIYDNNASLEVLNLVSLSSVSFCYLAGGLVGVDTSTNSVSVSYCTIDDCTTGIIFLSNTAPNPIIGNLITNCTDGIDTTSANNILHNNFYGNSADLKAGSSAYLKQNNLFLNPQYVNIGSHDYTIQNANLMNISMIPVLGSHNIGAYQYNGGSSSGILVHSGMSGGII